jgi:hypothetical protein
VAGPAIEAARPFRSWLRHHAKIEAVVSAHRSRQAARVRYRPSSSGQSAPTAWLLWSQTRSAVDDRRTGAPDSEPRDRLLARRLEPEAAGAPPWPVRGSPSSSDATLPRPTSNALPIPRRSSRAVSAVAGDCSWAKAIARHAPRAEGGEHASGGWVNADRGETRGYAAVRQIATSGFTRTHKQSAAVRIGSPVQRVGNGPAALARGGRVCWAWRTRRSTRPCRPNMPPPRPPLLRDGSNSPGTR